jgi:transketolase
VKDKPSLIICRTIIGFGSPNKAGSEESHGAALGEKRWRWPAQQLGWKYPPFEIPKEIYSGLARPRGEKAEHAWNEKFAAYQQQFRSWPLS